MASKGHGLRLYSRGNCVWLGYCAIQQISKTHRKSTIILKRKGKRKGNKSRHWLQWFVVRHRLSGSEGEASASIFALRVFVGSTPDRYNGRPQWKTANSFCICEWTEGSPGLRRDKYSTPPEACWLARPGSTMTVPPLPSTCNLLKFVLFHGRVIYHWHLFATSNGGPLWWGKVQGSWPKLKQTFYQLTIAFSSSWLFPRSFWFSFCWLPLTPPVLYHSRFCFVFFFFFLKITEPPG